MIAIHQQELLVEFHGGRLVLFERQWLERSLARAAEQAGYSQWWLAEHVTESVAAYFVDHLALPIIAIHRLESAVKRVLESIGYSEVARRFTPAAPPLEINLCALAIEAEAGFELVFYPLLEAAIEAGARSHPDEFRFIGVHACVKRLTSSKLWCGDCHRVREEILRFIDFRMVALRRNHLIYSVR